MEIILKVTGIDCANCAAKIENKISKIKGVTDAGVNFMTGKVFIEVDEKALSKKDEILAEVEKIISKIEPDAVIEK